jgi:hypothetical protein
VAGTGALGSGLLSWVAAVERVFSGDNGDGAVFLSELGRGKRCLTRFLILGGFSVLVLLASGAWAGPFELANSLRLTVAARAFLCTSSGFFSGLCGDSLSGDDSSESTAKGAVSFEGRFVSTLSFEAARRGGASRLRSPRSGCGEARLVVGRGGGAAAGAGEASGDPPPRSSPILEMNGESPVARLGGVGGRIWSSRVSELITSQPVNCTSWRTALRCRIVLRKPQQSSIMVIS